MYQMQRIIAWQKPYLLQQNKKMWPKVLTTQLFATGANDHHVVAVDTYCHDTRKVTIVSANQPMVEASTDSCYTGTS
jgi:hypothetical protein